MCGRDNEMDVKIALDHGPVLRRTGAMIADLPRTSWGDEAHLQQDVASAGSRSGERDGPKLAVVITCYNYEEFVGRAIRSVIMILRKIQFKKVLTAL